jgi:hypothetical protein
VSKIVRVPVGIPAWNWKGTDWPADPLTSYIEPDADELQVSDFTVGEVESSQPFPDALFTTLLLVTWAEAQA